LLAFNIRFPFSNFGFADVMAIEIDFTLSFDCCYNGCLAFDDFWSFWLFERTVVFCFNAWVPLDCMWSGAGGYFMSAVEMAMVGLQVVTMVMSQELSAHEVAAATELELSMAAA
jgi:hypothetical protein